MSTSNLNKLSRQVFETLEKKFGATNEQMFRKEGNTVMNFFNTAESRVKVFIRTEVTREGDVKSMYVGLAVEEADRKGVFFNIGDRLHFDLTSFPEFQFHKDLANKLSSTFADTDFPVEKFRDVLAYAKELCEKV